MARRKRNSDCSIKRHAPRQPRKRHILAVCEGERTEPDYLHGFERHVRNATVEVEIPPLHGDPKYLLECAKDLKTKAERQARREGDPNLRFDEVWCVFDRDEHPRFDAAVTMARDNGIEVAASNPCFELWLLLHFRESPGMRSPYEVQRLLREHLPGFDKQLDFDLVKHGVDDATTRARRLDADAEAMGEAGRNPTTNVCRLTDSIAGRGAA